MVLRHIQLIFEAISLMLRHRYIVHAHSADMG